MNLTIDQVSKLTKLAVPTLRAYTTRMSLGKKVGNKRVYTQADVQKLLKVSKKSSVKRNAKSPAKKAVARKRPVKSKPTKASIVPLKETAGMLTPVSTKRAKPSFWSRLFRGDKQKKVVSLMDAKLTK